MIALGFGISMISSLPYAPDLVVPGISFGAWNPIFQTVLYVMLVSVTRKIRRTHIISFMMVLLSAAILYFIKMMIGAVPDEIHLRTFVFGGSLPLMCSGIVPMLMSKMLLLIADLFSNSPSHTITLISEGSRQCSTFHVWLSLSQRRRFSWETLRESGSEQW